MASLMHLRLIKTEWPENPYLNLAYEEAFYKLTDTPTIRFWRNNKAVVIGRLQFPITEINAIIAKNLGVKLVRRFTGGGAVYHDLGVLNYSVVVSSISLEEAFKLTGEVVVNVLHELGVKNAYYKPLTDIDVDELKISGLAGSKYGNRIIVHGSMLISSDKNTLWQVLRASKREEEVVKKKFTHSRVRQVITLEEILGKVDFSDITERLALTFSKKLGLIIEPSQATIRELLFAVDLYWKKYSTLEWNLTYISELKELASDDEYQALMEISKPNIHQDRVVKDLMKTLNIVKFNT